MDLYANGEVLLMHVMPQLLLQGPRLELGRSKPAAKECVASFLTGATHVNQLGCARRQQCPK